jgi:hypothetical protein
VKVKGKEHVPVDIEQKDREVIGYNIQVEQEEKDEMQYKDAENGCMQVGNGYMQVGNDYMQVENDYMQVENDYMQVENDYMQVEEENEDEYEVGLGKLVPMEDEQKKVDWEI